MNTVLDPTDGRIGFLVDLGNWKGPAKYAELAAVAGRAETCQAKVTTDAEGMIDETDFRRCLSILRDAGYAGPLALVYDGADPRRVGQTRRGVRDGPASLSRSGARPEYVARPTARESERTPMGSDRAPRRHTPARWGVTFAVKPGRQG